MTKTTKLFLFGGLGLAVLIISLAIGAYFVFQGSDEPEEKRNTTNQTEQGNDQSDSIERQEDDPPTETEYYESGEIKFEEWYLNGQLHRENDKPAAIAYDESGEIKGTFWYLNGQRHRENDKPAAIEYDESGEIKVKGWYLNGQLHRENDKPAFIMYDESGKVQLEEWYLNDVLIKAQP